MSLKLLKGLRNKNAETAANKVEAALKDAKEVTRNQKMKKVMLRTNDTSVDQAEASREDSPEAEKRENIVVHVKKAMKKETPKVKRTDLKSG